MLTVSLFTYAFGQNNCNYLIKEQCLHTLVGRGKTMCELNENHEDCATRSGSGSERRRAERKRKRNGLEKKEEERTGALRISRFPARQTKARRVGTRGGERSVSARAYSGRGRCDPTARSLPEFTPVFSTRPRSRVRARAYVYNALGATRERDPRRKAAPRQPRRRPCARYSTFEGG